MTDDLDVVVSIKIARRRVAELLVSAVEGGIGYWCPRQSFKYTKPAEWVPVLDDAERWPCYDYPLLPGGAVEFYVSARDFGGKGKKICRLDLETIAAGLKLMAEKTPGHFADFLHERDDARTADVFVQLCVFGEVVYG